LIKFAVGELGLTRWEFLQLRWDEYSYMCDGFFKKHEREWEKYRWVTYNMLIGNANIKSISKPSSFQAYLERFKPKKEPTGIEVEKREGYLERANKFFKRHNK